jgi:hypothetical protein
MFKIKKKLWKDETVLGVKQIPKSDISKNSRNFKRWTHID